MYVKRELQSKIDPLVISWGYDAEVPSGSVFQDYHSYQGTRDFSAFLVTPHALKFLEENNWEEEKKKCRDLLKHYYPIVAKQLESHAIAPLSDVFLGQICSIPIRTNNPIELKEMLYEKYKIEIPVIQFENTVYLRISFQAYNGEPEIETLINALVDIQKKTSLLS